MDGLYLRLALASVSDRGGVTGGPLEDSLPLESQGSCSNTAR
jgi:hypothetical protein